MSQLYSWIFSPWQIDVSFPSPSCRVCPGSCIGSRKVSHEWFETLWEANRRMNGNIMPPSPKTITAAARTTEDSHWKRIKCFRPHYARDIWKRNNFILGLCLICGQGNSKILVFKKLRCQTVCRPHWNAKPVWRASAFLRRGPNGVDSLKIFSK